MLIRRQNGYCKSDTFCECPRSTAILTLSHRSAVALREYSTRLPAQGRQLREVTPASSCLSGLSQFEALPALTVGGRQFSLPSRKLLVATTSLESAENVESLFIVYAQQFPVHVLP